MKRISKVLPQLLLTAALFVLFALSAAAAPHISRNGDAGACKSHTQTLVQLQDLSDAAGAKNAPQQSGKKTIPLVMIVVEFANMPYDDSIDWAQKIFLDQDSLQTYYDDMSFGQFTFTPAAESAAFGIGGNRNSFDAKNDGIIHVTLDTDHRDWSFESEPDETGSLLSALTAAIGQSDAYMDYASYDKDHDGKITTDELAIGFIVAGYESSATFSYVMGNEKYLWSMAWSFAEMIDDLLIDLALPHPDGVSVSSYIAISEYGSDDPAEPAAINLLAHELGHYLGLPDLYDTKYMNTRWGKYDVGVLSVMSDPWTQDENGNFCPCSLDVWSRTMLGWTEPEVASGTGSYTVSAQTYGSGEQAFHAIRINTQHPGEYYLLENRQLTKWDAPLSSYYSAKGLDSGVICWHIDDAVFDQYNAENTVNDYDHRPAVMPLFPERTGTKVSMIGSVIMSQPFFSSEYWNTAFWNNYTVPLADAIDLPIYGEGNTADTVSARSYSGITVTFTSASAADMALDVCLDGHRHFPVSVPAVSPTCTGKGVKAHWACSFCGAAFFDEEMTQPASAADLALPANGHRWDAGVTVTEPGCVTSGVIRFSCLDCEQTEDRQLQPLGHTAPNDAGKCARCGEVLVNEGEVCPLCQQVHTGPFAFLTKLIHRLIYFFRSLFQ